MVFILLVNITCKPTLILSCIFPSQNLQMEMEQRQKMQVIFHLRLHILDLNQPYRFNVILICFQDGARIQRFDG
jgi:hypothetical protein